MAKNIVRGFNEEAYPPIPTRATKFWRRSILKQVIMFLSLIHISEPTRPY